MTPFIKGWTTGHPYGQKEHIEISNILEFGEWDTAIQNFQNLLSNNDVWTVCPAIHTSLINFKSLNSCILFNIGPIDTKLQIFRNLIVLFLTIWVSLSHNKPTQSQPLSV